MHVQLRATTLHRLFCLTCAFNNKKEILFLKLMMYVFNANRTCIMMFVAISANERMEMFAAIFNALSPVYFLTKACNHIRWLMHTSCLF